MGVAMGQGVVWYTGQFYAMSFLKTVMNIDAQQVDTLMGIALLIGTPFFVVFGWMSDKIGRKKIMLAGMLLAIICYRPIYRLMYERTNVENKKELIASSKTDTSASIVAEGTDSLYVTTTNYSDGTVWNQKKTVHLDESGKVIVAAGKPRIDNKISITIPSSDKWFLTFLVFIQVIFVTMVYGPIAAFLVEMFPVQIRYTSMSLPYHIGNGIFGGLLPAISTYLVTQSKETGNAEFYLDGLWYPIIIAGVSFLIGCEG
jgi:MFS family permease